MRLARDCLLAALALAAIWGAAVGFGWVLAHLLT